MVGVPGRSRACQNCKKRRVACDLRTPACGQCMNTKRICPGYARDLIFVRNQRGSHKTKYEKELGGLGGSSPAAGNEGLGNGVVERGLTGIPKMLDSGPCVTEQLFSTALEVWQPAVGGGRGQAPPWTSVLSLLGDTTPATKAPALACYMAWMGRKTDDRFLVEASLQLYLQGLSEVQRSLSRTETALGDNVLAGLLSLILYEALECPEYTRTAYGWHVDGCMKLVALRGVRVHREGVGHQLFLAFRTYGILRALELRHPVFLSTASWSTIPWEINPKTTYDRLLDLLVMGPEIFYQADHMNDGPPTEILTKALSLLEQCYMLHLKLQIVYSEFCSESTEPLYWETTPTASAIEHPSQTTSLFPTILAFRDLEAARILTLYWSIATLLWSGVTDLCNALEASGCSALLQNGAAPGGLPFLSVRTQWQGTARNICRSFEYCMSPEHRDSGPFRISAPLSIAIGVMEGRKECAAEYKWAVQARKRLADLLYLLKPL